MRIALIHIARGMDGTPASPIIDHLGLQCLEGALSKKHNVQIFDTALLRIDDASLLQKVVAFSPDIAGFTLNYINCKDVEFFSASLKKIYPAIRILAGGLYATFHQESLLRPDSPFDAVVLGEGETPLLHMASTEQWNTIPGVAVRCGSQLVSNPPLRPNDFFDLPNRSFSQLPALAKFPRGCAKAALEASRGCTHACSFCSIAASQKMARDSCRRRLRPTEDIAKEISYIHDTFGMHDFWFMDADFLGPTAEQKRIHRLSQQIRDLGIRNLTLEIDARVDGVSSASIAKLAEAGLQKCFLGVESFDATTLNRFSKGTTPAMNLQAIEILEQEGVRPIIGVIMFHPQSTKDQLLRDHEALRLIGYEKTQMLFRLKKYRGSREAQSTDSDGRGIAPWADYGWEFSDPEIADIWSKFDSLRLAALDKVFVELTAKLERNTISVETFIQITDETFHKFGEDVDSIFC